MTRLCERIASNSKVPTELLLKEATAALEAAVAGVVEHHSIRCLVSVATRGQDSQLWQLGTV